jgi:S-DNA-T family DNA segregation ATPase FtsK/SpoIIIE
MLFQTAELSKPVRIQGAFISEEELKGVVEYLKGDEAPTYDDSIVAKPSASGTVNMFGGPTDDQDPMFAEAKAAVLEAGKASASYLQRRFKIGYARAARILDELEAAGIIGPGDGAKPREILVTEREVGATMGAGGEQTVFDEPEKEETEEDEENGEEEEKTKEE